MCGSCVDIYGAWGAVVCVRVGVARDLSERETVNEFLAVHTASTSLCASRYGKYLYSEKF